MNPMMLIKLQGAWNQFKNNHPKFPLFLTAVAGEGIREDTIIEIKITTPEGKDYNANLKLTAFDMELIETLKNLSLS